MQQKLRTHRKRLYFDIETSPNVGYFWQAGFKLNIGYENIIKERAIITICYKFEDDREVSFLTWDKKQCDKKMLAEFVKIANTADELCGHNSDKFDLAWIRTRCLFHGIEMFPTYTTIDTLKVSRSKFRFNSNRLDYIGKFLGLGKKLHTGFDLWKEVMNGSQKAMDKMVKYCKQDVTLLEKIHKALGNHIAPKHHYGMTFGSSKDECPECGSDDLKRAKQSFSATGQAKIQYQCKTCHKHFTRYDRKRTDKKPTQTGS